MDEELMDWYYGDCERSEYAFHMDCRPWLELWVWDTDKYIGRIALDWMGVS